MTRSERIEKAARSMLKDIEAMASYEGRPTFGGFTEYALLPDNSAVVVSWPNLRISANELIRAVESK